MKALITIILFTISSVSTFAIVPKTDTVYYMVDTAQTTVKDRMIQIGNEGPFKYYNILCTCLKYDNMPTFFFNTLKEGAVKTINNNNLKEISFISLAKLIELAKENEEKLFNESFIMIFVEHYRGTYIKHQVKFLKPQKREASKDYEIIKSDSTLKKKN